jgi:ABC-type transport system involved in multi-copper enzyme maturation permease subunit
VAVWSASVSVSEEVEGRTALTVLSKPVKRRQFILGKFLGVLGPVVVLFILLGFLFLVTVSFKVVYDARETAKTEPTWGACYVEMIRIVPGLVLAFFETVVLAAISVAISTRLPMLANLIVCSTIYVLGHLVPLVVNSSVGKFEIVRFVGQFMATVLPVLDHFNIQAAVAAGAVVPLDYLGMAFLYCVLYSAIAMLLGLAMFEDRDLA